MNKLGVLAGCLMLFLVTKVAAQEGLKLGIQGGLPFNDFNNEVGEVVGVDFGYMKALGEVVDVGVMVGFLNGFPEKYDRENPLVELPHVQFIPLTASVRIWPSDSFSFGIDAGYALGINDGNEGGLYYRPIIGYLLGPKTEINLSNTNVKLEDRDWTTITLGVLYTFMR